MSDYSITAEVELYSAADDADILTGATVHVEGHNLSENLAEGIARHHLAVELGLDIEELGFDLASSESRDGVTTFEFGAQEV